MPAASSIYWDSVDSQRSSSSGDANSGSGRHYVDPWDLENYAYLRRHSIATPQQYNPPPLPLPQQQRVAHRRRSHERRPEPEAEYWYAPREPIREPGYHAPASVEELYFGPPRQHNSHGSYYQPIYEDEAPHYAAPVPIYAPLSDCLYYCVACGKRFYVSSTRKFSLIVRYHTEDRKCEPSSHVKRTLQVHLLYTLHHKLPPALELEHSRNVEDQRLQGMLKRRSKLGKAKGHERDRGECFYHGSSSESRRDSVDELLPRRIKGPEDACYVEVAPPSNLGLNTYGHLKIDYTDSWNSLHRKIAK